MEWTWLKDWWRLKKWRYYEHGRNPESVSGIRDVADLDTCCYCDECFAELSEGNDDACMGGTELEGEGKQVLVGICAMAKKSQSKPMKEILTRLEEFEYIKIIVFPEEVILKESVEDWPIVDCLISFHSKGFPLDKAINYADLRNPFIINNLPMQYDIQDRRRVYAILESEGIEIPRYAVLDRDSADPKQPIPDHELVESEDHVEVNGVIFNKPFVEKPVSAEDHNIYIYYPTSAGGGSQRLFRKIGSRSSVYSPESRVRKTGSYIYEDFMPTDGTDVKVYTVGPDYAHAEARKSPALDGKVERDSEGKEIRYPVILSNAEKLISRKVCLAFKQTVCGFDLLRANGQSFVCDVNGFSFVKNSNKYYDDCAKILGNMILRELAPTLHIPWSVPFQLDDPPIVPTTFGKMMELRCVVAVIRHGDRTPKQKMKVEVRHPKFFEIFAKYDGYKHGHVKLKRPKQLQEILDTARSLLAEIQHRAAGPELEEKQGKLEQLKSVLEMYGHFSGINRKVQMKYQPRGRPRGSSSDDGNNHNRLGEPSLVLILKWGGELTPAGRIQAEELGRIFRCMYPGGQGRHLSEEDSEMLPNHGEYAGAQGLGLLRLHSTFRHDLKIYASDEGRVQMTAAAFAKGLLALEGELTPILVQMVKSANTNGLLDNDCDSSKYQNMVKTRLHELLQQDREFTREDREQINPGNALSINAALDFVKNPVKCCQHVHALIQKLMDIVRIKKDDPKTKDAILYHGETWELMGRRWGKIEKDFCTKNKRFDISKIPDIYDCIKYDLQHNNHTLQFDHAEELYIYAKYLADIVIPQEYGLTVQEKLTIGQGICTPLLKKIRADLQRNIEETGEETVNRLNPRYSHGVSSPGRHVRTRLYFTSESHVHSLLTVLRYGGLLDVVTDEQWRRAMEYVSMVSELNYMSQIVVMLYEDPTKDPSSEERFHVELHFSPGVNCCVQKNLPPGPGFRPHSRNESSHNMGENGGSGQDSVSQCSTRIEEEDTELSILEDEIINPTVQTETSPPSGQDIVDGQLDSPTTSRGIDMMDLDPNMMDEPYDSGFLQSSAPIPISARTVAGHEAARLGSQLAASQRQRREREASAMVEPRARSYDHQHQEKAEKAADKLQYQSLDAVNKEEHSNHSKNTLNVPVYLGQPIALPHSISSPELPIPLVKTSIPISTPLITVHDIPLASPTNYNPKKITSAQSSTKDLLLSDFDRYNPSLMTQEQYNKKETYGGFYSDLILPNIKVDGESNDFDPMSESLSMVNSSSLSLSSHNNLCSIGKTISTVNFATNSVDDTNIIKRSRSLSPCPTRCLCYNCNVSELILQSRDLPPLERSNFRTYFVRSLSHKFFNCSCYTLANIWQNLSPNVSQCSSCYDTVSSTDSLVQSCSQFLNPSCSLVHLPSQPNNKIYKKHYLMPISPEKRTFGFQSPIESPSKCNCVFSQRNYLRRDSHGIMDLSIFNDMKKTTEESMTHILRRSNSCPNIITGSSLEFVESHNDPHSYLGNNSSSISHCPQNRRRYSCSDTKKQNESQHLTDNGILHGHDHSNNSHYHESSHCKSNNHEPKCPRAPFSQLQPQRSFSSPDTRPSIIQPDPTCTARRHRHSISGQMSYFKLLGYNVSKKLTGSANSLFSTAVISGSSSAPNLKDMIPPHAMIPPHVAAIEGFGGVPPIRPLETLHNALSLRQLDSFLEMMTGAPLFRTPASSPPKYPSPGGLVNPNLNVGGISREYHSSDLEAVRYITPTPIQYKSCSDGDTCDIRNQPSPTSPNSTGWSSEPQSFLSSEPSSPAPTSTGECSMSISLISNDGAPSFSGAPKFPTTPGLDLDFNDFCMNIDQENHEGRGSVSYTDYYSNEDGQIRKNSSYSSPAQKTVVSSDDLPIDPVDDDEEHTLTLRQTEAQKKQDVKLLFEQAENPNATKSTVGYKKIGRFRVESMEISDDDVRIKETGSVCSSSDKNKSLTLPKVETANVERGPTHRSKKETRHKRKNFLRSQSVSTPKTIVVKSETNFSFKSVKSKESSFSTMTDKDLEQWKLSTSKQEDSSTSCTETGKEPILTVASSLTDSPSVTIGFDIQDEQNE
ncbi:PREDICTED: inositol hexakisphosphate and diphosphoinositol-pentakisphosphate kinase isoform X2 [Polistes canadensis]|uniref:inositol hexakisphosphate and diphosphoinositol-pentakisphosphate kinase isoform X2 n=1 Tax=Polistes canadensis TaxID=91411 RepID=UPI000718AE64|nr:PREDICTED: inositol hexakisphosphate and diphosphoinositol-pentakisphosphate kinase isoform X2 [Polistes canadensis]XP_014604487.1 PREDICTED: inositol hexakisphosphate and diphosphoinositol-pentakisphosphate kinase isoform X2 [Polistes canadensis]